MALSAERALGQWRACVALTAAIAAFVTTPGVVWVVSGPPARWLVVHAVLYVVALAAMLLVSARWWSWSRKPKRPLAEEAWRPTDAVVERPGTWWRPALLRLGGRFWTARHGPGHCEVLCRTDRALLVGGSGLAVLRVDGSPECFPARQATAHPGQVRPVDDDPSTPSTPARGEPRRRATESAALAVLVGAGFACAQLISGEAGVLAAVIGSVGVAAAGDRAASGSPDRPTWPNQGRSLPTPHSPRSLSTSRPAEPVGVRQFHRTGRQRPPPWPTTAARPFFHDDLA